MKKNKNIYIIFIIIFLSCKKNDNPKIQHTPYFDITAVAKKNIEINKATKAIAKKRITINQKSDTLIDSTIDWQKTFTILLECDINKEKYKTLYQQNFTQKTDSTSVETYETTSSKTPIKSITIYKKHQEVQQIDIKKNTKNFLFQNEQKITYLPYKSIQIQSKQRAIFMQDFNSDVQIFW